MEPGGFTNSTTKSMTNILKSSKTLHVERDIVQSVKGRAKSLGGTTFEHEHTKFRRLEEPNQVQNVEQQGIGRECTSKINTALNQRVSHKVGNEEVRKLSREGQLKEALEVLDLMDKQGFDAHSETYLNLLQAWIISKALSEGKRVHSNIEKSGFNSSILLGNALVHLYSKCGSLTDAYRLFHRMPERDLYTWTTMITGCVYHGHDEVAMTLFWLMEQEGLKPDAVTISCVLKACANLGALELGEKLHSHVNNRGFGSDMFVSSTLIDMYAKCGNMERARRVFDKMLKPNVVSWSALIAGYAQHGHIEEALNLFGQMVGARVKPNEVTLVSILNVFACLGTLDQGKQVHFHVIRSGINSNVLLESTLVDMYSKGGSLKDACQLFDKMLVRTSASWNVMIGAYAQHGLAEEAFELFQQMQHEGTKVDHITFISILSICSGVGLLNVGYEYFNSMHRDHGISQTEGHYACMVDLLSRAGHLEGTVDLIKNMPCQPTASMWMTLLSACRMCNDLQLAEQVADCVLELEPHNASALVLLSNTYVCACRHGKCA